MTHHDRAAEWSPLRQYDLSRPPRDNVERFARIDAAFELLYSHDGADADVIRRSNGKVVTAPNSDTQQVRVDRSFTERFYRIKLGLHLGRMPILQVDHANGNRSDNSLVNLREANARENGRNRGPAKRADLALPRCVYRTKDGRYEVVVRDQNGRKQRFGPFETLSEATASSRNYRRRRDGKYHRATPPGYRPRQQQSRST